MWSCLAYVAWTALLLTYAAWGAELTGAYHERSRVTGVREGFVIAGILLAASLPALAGVAPESREALALVFQSMLVLLPLALVSCCSACASRRPGGRRSCPSCKV